MNIDISQLKTLLRINGLHEQSSDDEINKVLAQSGYSAEQQAAALQILKGALVIEPQPPISAKAQLLPNSVSPVTDSKSAKYSFWTIFFIILGVIGILCLSAVTFFILSFINRPWDKTEDSIATVECGDFALVLHEDRSINRLEGSSVSYTLNYKDSTGSIIIDYLGSNLLEGVDPTPVNIPALPAQSFEVPARGADRENQTEYKTVYVSPKEFSKAQYDHITSCLASHREEMHVAFINYLKEVSKTDSGLNIYRSGTALRIIGTAYVDKQDFYNFVFSKFEGVGSLKSDAWGETTIGQNGLIKGQTSGYLGSYFDLTPETVAFLQEFDVKTEKGEPLITYLERLAAEVKLYQAK
ncbi:hypothetical protein BH11PAT2_BH11PAT2_09950 [soil metagenome]